MAGRIFSRFRNLCSDLFCTYSTVKQIEVRDTYIGIIHRILQFVVFAYIAFYIVWIQKGYQDVQEPHGSSIIKVKGVARVSSHNSNSNTKNVKKLLWDTTEYLIPPIENNAFFIATRKIVTYDQTLGTCPSALSDKLFCNSTYNPCKKGRPTSDSFGIFTGNCVLIQNDTRNSVCGIKAWCPQELSNSKFYKMNIVDLQNFTVFIKTIVSFAQYNIKIRTVKDNTNFSCRFNRYNNQRCPIFSIGYILDNLQDQTSKIDLMALYEQGGLIEIQQTWECNFDFAEQKRECFPVFTFNLLQSATDKLSPGINYRFAEKYKLNRKEYRTLTKVYGLRFILSIRGEGRRFNIVQLFIAIGSGVGYMIIAELICEFILMKFHKYRKEYRQNAVKMFSLKQVTKNDSINRSTAVKTDLTPIFVSSETAEKSVV